MKVIILNLTFLLTLFICEGCSTSGKDGVQHSDIQTTSDVLTIAEDSVSTESEEEDRIAQTDTIIGRFVPDRLDSIWIEETEDEYSYICGVIKSSIEGWRDVSIEYLSRTNMIYEGDLDGDGLDEFGMSYTLGDSNWCNYTIFSIREGRLYKMKEECRINLSDAVLEDLATPSGKRNIVKLLKADDIWDDPQTKDDWLGWEYNSYLVTASFEPFEK